MPLGRRFVAFNESTLEMIMFSIIHEEEEEEEGNIELPVRSAQPEEGEVERPDGRLSCRKNHELGSDVLPYLVC